MNGKIYVYINKEKIIKDGIIKLYIGQTTRSVEERVGFNGSGYHKYDENITSKFVNAIRKWGWDSFEGKVLIDGISTMKELNQLERLFVAMYDTYNNGYNSTLGGDGVAGCKHTGMYGKEFTDEHRKKLSESHKGKHCGENHPMYGKHHTEETKRKISEKSKEFQNKEETKKMQREKAMGNNYAIKQKSKM